MPPPVGAWFGDHDAGLSAAAAAVILVPSLLNVAKWRQRAAGGDFAGDI